MCRVYYPYFKIESNNPKSSYNHKLYIMVLSLFCEKILIPSRHLIEMGNDRFDILLSCKALFEEDVIYSRLSEKEQNLSDYYTRIINASGQAKMQIQKIRVDKILGILYKDKKVFETYNSFEQQAYYSDKMEVFLNEYVRKHHAVKGMNALKSLWKKGQDIVTKEEFDNALERFKKEKKITSQTYDRLRTGSDSMYFIAGVSGGKLKVCYDRYFRNKCIEEELKSTIVNYDDIINKRYNPKTIVDVLKKLKIIDNEHDVAKLDITDILYLRSQKCFKHFIKAYDKNSILDSFDDFIDTKRNAYKVICRIKTSIVTVVLTIISSVLSAFITKSMIYSLVISLITLVLTSFVTYLWQTKNKYQIPLIDPFLDAIISFFDPVSLYLAKLKWRIASKQ